MGERVAENLNRALHEVMAADPRVYLLGEDVCDPFGGAFKVTRGLSTRFPDRVRNTPISEAGIVGLANGLALCGDRPIVEIMFADFLMLGLDQLINFAAKSVTMYGRRLPIHLVIRCPVGGNRGYGPTHSQSPQKHLLGVPDLSVLELSAFHDAVPLLAGLVERGSPCVLFEDKVLYPRRRYHDGVVDDLFQYDFLDPARAFARVYAAGAGEIEWAILAPGGVADRAIAAARDLLLTHEITSQVIVPAQLYPLDLQPVLPLLARAGRVCVVEESMPGATWGAEVASRLHRQLWGRLRCPVTLVSSRDRVIPTAAHLEAQVLVQTDTITRAIAEAARA